MKCCFEESVFHPFLKVVKKL